MSARDDDMPGGPATLTIPVNGELDVAQVVGGVGWFCARHGLSALLAAHVATAASELANNLWMHATGGGVVHLSLLASGARRGIELVCEDRGPGIADLSQAMAEGFSTAGGLGCGLPGVRRLMDDFSIDSRAGAGTRVVARRWEAAPGASARAPGGHGPGRIGPGDAGRRRA